MRKRKKEIFNNKYLKNIFKFIFSEFFVAIEHIFSLTIVNNTSKMHLNVVKGMFKVLWKHKVTYMIR